MAEEKKMKWISVMIVPEDGAGVKKWRMTTRSFLRLKVLFGSAGVLLVLGIVSMIALGVMVFKVRSYQRANTQLLEAARKVADISARLDRYREKERTLRELLGSDIDLPKAPAETEEPAVGERTAPDTPGAGGNEIEAALARNEAVMRRRPNIWPVSNPWQVANTFKATGSTREIHHGIDIIAPKHSTVTAVADGRVTMSGKNELLGLLVVIDHENGWETQYGHNATLLVKAGDSVRKGQAIAVYGGREGMGTGPHLHFAVSYRGRPLNPLDVLPKEPLLRITAR